MIHGFDYFIRYQNLDEIYYLIIELTYIIDIINVKISIIVCVLRDDDWMSQITIADI